MKEIELAFDANLREKLDDIQTRLRNGTDHYFSGDLKLAILVETKEELEEALRIAETYDLVIMVGFKSWTAQRAAAESVDE